MPLQTGSGVTAALAASISLNAGRVSANPASLAFGPELAGGTTASQAVTISNPGTAALAFSSISASDSFAVASGGTCSTSSAVAPNGNCTVNVAFAPTMGGDLTGTLTLADNGIGSPHTVSLSGTGQDFVLAAVLGAAALLAALACAGCGQGGGPIHFRRSETPAGTYTLTVTGTLTSGSTTLTRSQSLTLKVQ